MFERAIDSQSDLDCNFRIKGGPMWANYINESISRANNDQGLTTYTFVKNLGNSAIYLFTKLGITIIFPAFLMKNSPIKKSSTFPTCWKQRIILRVYSTNFFIFTGPDKSLKCRDDEIWVLGPGTFLDNKGNVTTSKKIWLTSTMCKKAQDLPEIM